MDVILSHVLNCHCHFICMCKAHVEQPLCFWNPLLLGQRFHLVHALHTSRSAEQRLDTIKPSEYHYNSRIRSDLINIAGARISEWPCAGHSLAPCGSSLASTPSKDLLSESCDTYLKLTVTVVRFVCSCNYSAAGRSVTAVREEFRFFLL